MSRPRTRVMNCSTRGLWLTVVCNIVFMIILTGCRGSEGQFSDFIKEDQVAGESSFVVSGSESTPTQAPSSSPNNPLPLEKIDVRPPSTAEEIDSPEPTARATPKPTPEPAKSTEPQSENKKQQIDTIYDKQFAALKSSCKAKVAGLSGEVKAYIQNAKASNEQITVADLQKSFMSKITSAEADCDQSFNEILSRAKQDYEKAGLDTAGLSDWTEEYNTSKNQARRQALAQIISAWNSRAE